MINPYAHTFMIATRTENQISRPPRTTRDNKPRRYLSWFRRKNEKAGPTIAWPAPMHWKTSSKD